MHLCEAFLGIYPHFDLFKSLFFLNPYPNFKNVAIVGGANLELRPDMAGRYIPYTPRRQLVIGGPSGFISIIMRRHFPTEFLVRLSSVMSGSTMDIFKLRKINCCKELLF